MISGGEKKRREKSSEEQADVVSDVRGREWTVRGKNESAASSRKLVQYVSFDRSVKYTRHRDLRSQVCFRSILMSI